MTNCFYDLNLFPQLASLRDKWTVIRDEALALAAPRTPIHRVGKRHEEVYGEVALHVQNGGSYGWLDGWGRDGANNDWLQYGLIYKDKPIEFLDRQVENTIALLSKIDGINVAAFLKLKPNSLLPTHNHPELRDLGLLQMHLTLDAASSRNFSYLNVEGEFRQHVPGEAFVFDGSNYHFALNASDADRTILYIEFKINYSPENIKIDAAVYES
ncbi:aspartyl/asparaginyl beta-hydroxylase domain-containing protein [Rhizobium sp. C4]|uniref:aspartyl/asparaginyl beta-hydroxylase domain-containing protein n=1 Tax=Rhizobium sp. C4 TaxID=1349800 RepID=UPI001E4C56F4|nr:aspartyl/asparaginyl beta-hydroxylase domain-containing protein [Rhizobium sp. C4]MCD2175097.1 aspartyl/asparaginyl beta-hydroxylase domain-containing protein [Rhizobium sp. C4]